jgi:hypothetical protein
MTLIVTESEGECAKRGDAGAEGGGDPRFQEVFGGIEVSGLKHPESFEFVFEDPGAVNTAVGGTDIVDGLGLFVGTVAGVQSKKPAQTFDRAARLAGRETAPLLEADLVDGFVEGLDDVEAVQNERGIRAVMLDGVDISTAHITAGPANAASLVNGEVIVEEAVDGFTSLAGTDPDDAGAIQIVDDGGELATLGERDFVDADSDQSADFVTGAGAGNDAVEQIGEGGFGHAQHEGGGALSCQAAQRADAVFQSVSDPRHRRRPRDIFLETAMIAANNLVGSVVEPDGDSKDSQISPDAIFSEPTSNTAAATAEWTPATVLKGLDDEVEFFGTFLQPDG